MLEGMLNSYLYQEIDSDSLQPLPQRLRNLSLHNLHLVENAATKDFSLSVGRDKKAASICSFSNLSIHIVAHRQDKP